MPSFDDGVDFDARDEVMGLSPTEADMERKVGELLKSRARAPWIQRTIYTVILLTGGLLGSGGMHLATKQERKEGADAKIALKNAEQDNAALQMQNDALMRMNDKQAKHLKALRFMNDALNVLGGGGNPWPPLPAWQWHRQPERRIELPIFPDPVPGLDGKLKDLMKEIKDDMPKQKDELLKIEERQKEIDRILEELKRDLKKNEGELHKRMEDLLPRLDDFDKKADVKKGKKGKL